MSWARLFDLAFFLLAYAAVIAGYWFFLSAQRPRVSNRDKAYAILAFLGTAALWIAWALRQSKYGFNIGWDFSQFYIAAHLPASHLFDRSAFVALGKNRLAPIGVLYYPPYVRPALFALAFRPLAWLSYWHAYWTFACVVFAGYAASLYVLFRRLQLPLKLLPAFGVFFPAAFGIIIGQDACAYLLVLLAGVVLSDDGKDRAAGLAFGLCTYKFHLLLLIPLVLLIKGRWKTIVTFALVAAVVALLSIRMAPLSEYLRMIRLAPSYGIGFTPGALHGVMVQFNHETWYYPAALVGLAGCAYLIWRLPLMGAYSVAIIGALLFGYYSNWYDCSLLVIPIAILWQRAGTPGKVILLALLLYPPAWSRGEQLFQVTTELALLSQFCRSMERSPEQARGPADDLPLRHGTVNSSIQSEHD